MDLASIPLHHLVQLLFFLFSVRRVLRCFKLFLKILCNIAVKLFQSHIILLRPFVSPLSMIFLRPPYMSSHKFYCLQILFIFILEVLPVFLVALLQIYLVSEFLKITLSLILPLSFFLRYCLQPLLSSRLDLLFFQSSLFDEIIYVKFFFDLLFFNRIIQSAIHIVASVIIYLCALVEGQAGVLEQIWRVVDLSLLEFVPLDVDALVCEVRLL